MSGSRPCDGLSEPDTDNGPTANGLRHSRPGPHAKTQRMCGCGAPQCRSQHWRGCCCSIAASVRWLFAVWGSWLRDCNGTHKCISTCITQLFFIQRSFFFLCVFECAFRVGGSCAQRWCCTAVVVLARTSGAVGLGSPATAGTGSSFARGPTWSWFNCYCAHTQPQSQCGTRCFVA